MSKQKLIPLALGALLLAGCGGDSVLERERDDAVKAAEEAQAALEKEKAAREMAAAEAAKAKQAEAEAKRQADAAAQQRQAEAERRAAAERARDEALEEQQAAEAEVNQANAARVLAGVPSEIPTTPTIEATPRYNAAATITVPGSTWTSASTGRLRGWYSTTRKGRASGRVDTVNVYSNVEAPKRINFQDSDLNESGLFGENGVVTGDIDITNADHGSIAAASRFPRTSGAVTINVKDRGEHANSGERDNAIATACVDSTSPACATARASKVRPADIPETHRFSEDVTGTLQGALGKFRCVGTAVTSTCTVTATGPGNFAFTGTWHFIPSSATAKVVVSDDEHMWFGWWEKAPTDAGGDYDFSVGYGGSNPVTSFDGATGEATYTGPAVGKYVVHDQVGNLSADGAFTAKAVLTADFGDGTEAGTVSGVISEFSNDSTWSVTLKSKAVAAADEGEVSWSIGDNTQDGGEWSASFHSNFASPGANVQPTGVAGAFAAQHGSFRKLIGAFGAERD